MIIEKLEIGEVISDLYKENSTQGIRYILKRGANAHLELANKYEGLLLSVENLSSLLNTFRGSSSEGNQFQIQIGPNSLSDIYIPADQSYIFAADSDLKIASVKYIQSANLDLYDIVHPPVPAFNIQSNSVIFNRDGAYQLEKVSSVFLNFPEGKDNYIYFVLSGDDVVARMGDFRLRSARSVTYLSPALPQTLNFSLGSRNPYTLKIAFLQKKFINPAFVSPEAALWSFPNEAIQ